MEALYEKLKKSWPYLWPTFLLPLSLIYAIDLIHFLLTSIQTVLVLIMVGSTGSFLAGAIFAILKMPGKENPIMTMRLAKIIRPITWGHDLMSWLIEDEVKTTAQGSKKDIPSEKGDG